MLQIKSVQKMLAGNGVELELTDAALISSHRSAMIRNSVHVL